METPTTLNVYSALRIEEGMIRRLWFEAPDETAAMNLCSRYGVGYEGPSQPPGSSAPLTPVAFDGKTTRAMLGGVSASTLYRLLATGQLERVAGTFRVLVTRSSIERFARFSGHRV